MISVSSHSWPSWSDTNVVWQKPPDLVLEAEEATRVRSQRVRKRAGKRDGRRRRDAPRQVVHHPLGPRVEVGQVLGLLGDLVDVRQRQECRDRVDVLLPGGESGAQGQSAREAERRRRQTQGRRTLDGVPLANWWSNQSTIVLSMTGSDVTWYD